MCLGFAHGPAGDTIHRWMERDGKLEYYEDEDRPPPHNAPFHGRLHPSLCTLPAAVVLLPGLKKYLGSRIHGFPICVARGVVVYHFCFLLGRGILPP